MESVNSSRALAHLRDAEYGIRALVDRISLSSSPHGSAGAPVTVYRTQGRGRDPVRLLTASTCGAGMAETSAELRESGGRVYPAAPVLRVQ